MNKQQPQKPDYRTDGALEVHSIFSTIQGEGPFVGQRATFIRLAGCNLQCPQCDTEYLVSKHPDIDTEYPGKYLQEVTHILDEVVIYPNDLVVITGGEPFRQNLLPLVVALLDANFIVQIETNGTLYQDLPYQAITVVCSPKTGSINKDLLPHIAALKYVVSSDDVAKEDGLPNHALGHPAMPRLARPPEGFEGYVYIQPADEKDEEKNQWNLEAAVHSTLKFGYILCLQVHKIAGVA